MNSKTILGLIQASRPINVIIAMLTAVVAIIFLNQELKINMLPAVLIVGCTTILANTTNDIIDTKIDQINRIDRPLPSGAVTLKSINIYSGTIFLLLLFIIASNSVHTNAKIFVLLIIFPAIAIYNLYLKRSPLVGNIVVAMILGSVFIFIELAITGALKFSFTPFMLATLLSFPRELIKDIEDIKGDSNNNIRTFPVVFGKQKSLFIFKISIITLIIFSIYVYTYIEGFELLYIMLLVPLIHIPLLFCLYVTTYKTNISYRLISMILKICTCFGLVVILFGKTA